MEAEANIRRIEPPRARAADPKVYGRSKVRNGRLFPDIDGRNVWVRRCKDLIAMHLSDLGGIDNCSAAEQSIVRRASTMTVELERLEAKFALAGEADPNELDLYARVAANLRRMLEAIGLQRRARDITPSLDQYLAKKAEQHNDDAQS